MLKVNVAITNISAERFWDLQKAIPPIQIGTNINVISIEKNKKGVLIVPFVLSINYNPSIAQIIHCDYRMMLFSYYVRCELRRNMERT